MWYNLKSISICYIPTVVQLKFSFRLTPMHMSLFSDKLIIFQASRFKEISSIEHGGTSALFKFFYPT